MCLHVGPYAAPIGKALYKLLTIQAFRADRLMAMASIFVATVMGETFTHSADQELNLAEIVTYEVGTWYACTESYCVGVDL